MKEPSAAAKSFYRQLIYSLLAAKIIFKPANIDLEEEYSKGYIFFF